MTQIPESSMNWEELVPIDGVKFSPRNAHASCVFKGEIWVTGGRTDLYSMYNLLNSYKVSDVWHSKDGAIWKQITKLRGDFFAQSTDVIQPGPLAPWFPRYGHTLSVVDINNDQADDYMLLAGGYAPGPSNDMWLTSDGITWYYCGHADWSPRAWHATATFQGRLWLTGGTPLNNEVWVLKNITQISRRQPLTRSMYMNETYSITWEKITHASWAPRVGMTLLSHWYFNETRGETYLDSKERMLLIGGYGGWTKDHPEYDGNHCYPDVWMTMDGYNWTALNTNATFGSRAWFGAAILPSNDSRLDFPLPSRHLPARIYLFTGGNIGFYTSNTKQILSMEGKMDAYWSRDGVNWVMINFQEGGDKSSVTRYSSQEWTKSVVDTKNVYIGMWGPTLVAFNSSNGWASPNRLILIGGDRTDGGSMSSTVYGSFGGIFCDKGGVACNYNGVCGEGALGCVCSEGYTGEYCEIHVPIVASSTSFWKLSIPPLILIIMLSFILHR